MRIYLINPSNPLVSIANGGENGGSRYRALNPWSLMVLAGLTPPECEVSILDADPGVCPTRSTEAPRRRRTRGYRRCPRRPTGSSIFWKDAIFARPAGVFNGTAYADFMRQHGKRHDTSSVPALPRGLTKPAERAPTV